MSVLNKLNDIQQVFIRFYTFLQHWAMVVDKRKNEEYFIFDYQKALQQKKVLYSEIDNLEQILLELERIL